MFKQRLLTTLILGPLVLATIYYAYYWVLIAIVMLLITGCAYEWLQLVPVKSNGCKIGFMLATLGACCLVLSFFNPWLYVGILVWLMLVGFIIQYPKSELIWGHAWVVAGFCFLLLPLFMNSLFAIFSMPHGRGLTIYLLFLVWAADIGAYLAGKRWGAHKLIPRVSPGKTIEGAVAGFILAMLVAFVGYLVFAPAAVFNWLFIAVVVALMTLFGDLFISMLKRRTNIKDTGQLIPGHGGLLDRLDSLLAGAPFFYTGLLLLSPGI